MYIYVDLVYQYMIKWRLIKYSKSQADIYIRTGERLIALKSIRIDISARNLN